ncbi:MAG: 50S ribosomal protein L16 [archaeon]
MAKIRKGCTCRNIERPNTRKSKYRKKSFVRGAPVCKIVKFNVGNLTSDFKYRVDLCSKEHVQARDNGIEAARTTANRTLEKVLGKVGFRLQVRVYPHHVVREHALASGAGADRFSSGMAHSFGKPVGNSAQLKVGQIVMSAYVNENGIDLARKAFRRANNKLPMTTTVAVKKL